MTCYFMRNRIKKLLEKYKITNLKKLEKILLENFTDKELHQMSDDQLTEIIKLVYQERKNELTEDALLIYI